MRAKLLMAIGLGLAWGMAPAQEAASPAPAEAPAPSREERIKAHEARIRELQQKLNETNRARDRRRNDTWHLRDYANSSSNSVNNIRRNIADIERNLGNATTNQIPHHTQQVKRLGAELKAIEQTAKGNNRELQVQKLDNAVAAQRSVRERLAKLRELLATEVPEQVKVAPEVHQEHELVTKDATRMEIVEAYDLAKDIENQIIESFKDLKATETAITKKMSYANAQKLTDVPKPVRLEANAEALQTKARTKEALDVQKEEQVKVVREAETMVDATVEMMKEAMEIVMPKEEGPHEMEDSDAIRWLTEEDFLKRENPEEQKKRLEEMNETVEYQVQLTAAAAENEAERAKDIADLMKENASPDQEVHATKIRVPPPIKPEDLDLMPGNVMDFSGKSGLVAKWMYVNDWYVIGPFPNPNRENLRRKFPPESVVDLNATYAGNDGETVSWKFWQAQSSILNKTERADVVPHTWKEYVIWYAYAEVFFSEECDRWVAIGSDDRSDLWINQYPVWGSSNKLKSWNISEGFRRCHFKKGRNELLIRVENGHHFCNWSVCISTDDSR